MIAGVYNIFCEQGTTFGRTFELQYPDPVDPSIFHVYDLSAHMARLQVRRTVGSSAVLIELTTENNGIEIDATLGKISVQITSTQTSALTSSGVYDLEIVDAGGGVSRVVQGSFTLSLEVTR